MAVPLNQAIRVGAYVLKQHLIGRKRYPLVLMLEPLFRCNLACAGCGKIDYPAEILNQRLSVAQCMEAVEECGAPVVVIAGGEPLLHREIDQIVEVASAKGLLVRAGYNHRYHPAFQQARKIFDSGVLGPLMFIRARYGHGGRVNYDKEWRADPKLSGGGELIDQGVHLIDLAGWFLGDWTRIDGYVNTFFWNMPVDDNAFLHLCNSAGQTAWLHASCTEWKNLFSFEIYGKVGKLHIEGLGGSYGVERLYHYQMLPEMGPPETTIYEFPRGDDSWGLETREFVEDIRLKRQPVPGLKEARAVMNVVDTVYRQSESGQQRLASAE